ncbi:hypothetical protein [Mogibacterium timidum]|uniref:Uncharacterized protein n=1 Tax=Mogibacterium timidum TaxID=35519 RepID=A0A7Y9B0V1_9FIRM|nr:hypothetical protein [Mogibacterium timidum]NWO23493.1 hypothetical protein [Mogibacterium timidum]
MTKPCESIRIKNAVDICKNNPLNKNFDFYYQNVWCHVKTCLNQLCKIRGYNDKNIEYKIEEVNFFTKNIPHIEGECFFIQFTNDGYVVVVGAGYDYGISKNDRYLSVKIINKLNKEWSNKAILVFVKGIKPVEGRRGAGHAYCEHLLQCRNGVEMYLGEYILEKGIPILNAYSHKNYHMYSSEEWKKIVAKIISDNKKDRNN